ncbi:hypothetical protein GPECTOR_1g790 [Gonium pectorale]|uniref:Expansin-like EG45 domain-containing protein n=1 Tax=Gonium pectorale TaxID=33097 RepID=A0A150H432_GONPE|nr:hypothetical protein GPECTOR_1g790 [Gonium pectorale]|eukprot:KXZ56876.1 hypothetical protein GPECTOR_1g790 [Gonium pectorale]
MQQCNKQAPPRMGATAAALSSALAIAAVMAVFAAGAHAQGAARASAAAGAVANGANSADATSNGGAAELPPPPAPGWVRGRTTYYGGPDYLSAAYDPARGNGSFGILTYGSCGYTNSDGTLPFPADAVAAAADADTDYPGSCGRCYQVKCVNGIVAANSTSPVRIINGFYDGDRFRPYLPAINRNITDTRGRPWPGNPAESRGLQDVRCWDPNQVVTVRIIDSCPCRQVLAETAPGVQKGGEIRRQEWCCGGQNHFDLSFFAFEQLAHPVYGVMSVDYRPVACDTNQPLPPPPAPGFVSSVVYDEVIRPGWSWFPYSAGYFRLQQQGAGLDGSTGTCVQLSPGGGLSFRCRQCGRPGYQPFAGASGIGFWIRSTSNSSDPLESSTPQGVVPPLKLFVMADGSTGGDEHKYCFNEVYLNTTKPVETRGPWYHIIVPLADFKCEGAVPSTELNRFDLQNTNDRNANICLDEIRIDK